MADVAEYTEFWVACAAAGPVLLIPAYLMVRQEQAAASPVRSGLSIGSVCLLAVATILALVQLSDGTPVHGGQTGRIIELVLICGPVASLVVSLLRNQGGQGHRDGEGHSGTQSPAVDEMGLPEIPQ